MNDELIRSYRYPGAYLLERAGELRRMAQAATSEETRVALLQLADRFVAVSDKCAVASGNPSCC
jgi:hypothetical protein